jgi:hypothetical protein
MRHRAFKKIVRNAPRAIGRSLDETGAAQRFEPPLMGKPKVR